LTIAARLAACSDAFLRISLSSAAMRASCSCFCDSSSASLAETIALLAPGGAWNSAPVPAARRRAI